MNTNMPNAGSPANYSIRHAAWILGVDSDKVCQLIRIGVLPTVRRRSRLVVPAAALRRLLSGGAR
ncbi:helix-turn-helix domain-containing protein [Amycolatopsis sp. NPDC059657]|uniref:helix-turn-helix domain-containing protein n=1 Tax=Amycolatopsis sp. NPDC059657 TaxID=3346899 RepID=UPI003671D594